MAKLVECVPNFSEGNDMHIIDQITAEIKAVEGVSLIDVDPGKATNRTVVTMVGTPEEVCEAAFRAVKKASELIDMKNTRERIPVSELQTFVLWFRYQTSRWKRPWNTLVLWQNVLGKN